MQLEIGQSGFSFVGESGAGKHWGECCSSFARESGTRTNRAVLCSTHGTKNAGQNRVESCFSFTEDNGTGQNWAGFH